jgi:hypothetical protein
MGGGGSVLLGLVGASAMQGMVHAQLTLSTADHNTLDGLIRFLSSPSPWFSSARGAWDVENDDHRNHHHVVAVCGVPRRHVWPE